MSCNYDKLKYLNETKQMFREKIDPKGEKITDETPFRDYVGKIGGNEPVSTSVYTHSLTGFVSTAEKGEV